MLEPMVSNDANIVLIGMPGVGKSTVGVLLAKALAWDFVDTDVLIQVAEGAGLQDIIDFRGLDEFRRIEERHVLGLQCRRCVVATGGSVVYSPAAMAHLRRSGTVIALELPLSTLVARLPDLATRGVAMTPGMTLADLHRERQPLYRRYADHVVDCTDMGHDTVLRAIRRAAGHSGAMR